MNRDVSMRMRATALAACAAGLLAAPAAHGAERVIVDLPRESPVSVWNRIAVFSRWDPSIKQWRLTISRNGGAPERLPVPPRTIAFDADIGPDADGKNAAIVYSRCRREYPDIYGCAVYRVRLKDKSRKESRISSIDGGTTSEYLPTIWKKRIGFVRSRDGDPTIEQNVYTRLLNTSGAKTQRSTGGPIRFCKDDGTCTESSNRNIAQVELYGTKIAVRAVYSLPADFGLGADDVRLNDVEDQGAKLIARQSIGSVGGARWVGLTFDRGKLYWARTCRLDIRVCAPEVSGAYRYDTKKRTYALAGFQRALQGFAYAGGGRALEVRELPDAAANTCSRFPQTADPPPCPLILTDPMTFASAAAPKSLGPVLPPSGT